MNTIKEATKLLNNLKRRAVMKPATFCENYGQSEIRKFEDKMNKEDVPYSERAAAINILSQISDFSPYQ